MFSQFIFLISILLLSAVSFGQPFAGAHKNLSQLNTCKYSKIYSSASETYLILNIVDRLAKEKKALDGSFDVQEFIDQISRGVETDCASAKPIALENVVFSSQMLSFNYGSGAQVVEWRSYDGALYVVYKKLYGSYKNEPLMVVKLKDGKKVFTRVTGRFGPDQSNLRYTFYFKGDGESPIIRVELKNKNRRQIKSLKSIYGEGFQKVNPLMKVGVIGTGIDYNHPGVAKHLAYRDGFEKNLQQLEAWQEDLRESPFVSPDEYVDLSEKFKKLNVATGFPSWMDQAMGSRFPFDSVIVNQKRSARGTQEHETRVTSRIIRTAGPIEIHFARRTMGSMDILNVDEVVKNFADKGVRLINLSFGSKCGGLPMEEKMWGEVFAKYPNIVFVVSAGNSGFDTSVTPFCPANFSQEFKNVISVTALDGNGQLAVYFSTPVNFGSSIDLAIKSDNLPVLVPYRKSLKWENNADGATSLAAAEVSRILTEAILEGLEWDAQTVKDHLVSTSIEKMVLKGVNKHGSEVDEWAFRERLKQLRQ